MFVLVFQNPNWASDLNFSHLLHVHYVNSIDNPSIGRQGCNLSFTSDLRQHGLSKTILPHQQHLTAFSPSLSPLSPSERPITHEQINIQTSGYAPQCQNDTYDGGFPNPSQNYIEPGLDSFQLQIPLPSPSSHAQFSIEIWPAAI